METKKDNIKTIIDKHFDKIDTPIGLEERISNKIDLFAKEDQEVLMQDKSSKKLFIKQTLSIAAVLILIITATIFLTQHKEEKLEIADTCTSPEEAYLETQAAFTYLAEMFDKGVSKVNESSRPITESKKIINKYIR